MVFIPEQLGPAAKELLGAWSLLPKHGYVPDRESFDPMSVARILPVLVLFERVGDQEWRFRLAGTEIDRRWGRKVTGLDYTELVAPEAAAVIRHVFDEIVRRPCGSWSIARVEFSASQSNIIEILHLPLRGKDGRVSLVLGCGGEPARRGPYQPDQPHSIGQIEQQRFFDIGAGIAVSSALPTA